MSRVLAVLARQMLDQHRPPAPAETSDIQRLLQIIAIAAVSIAEDQHPRAQGRGE